MLIRFADCMFLDCLQWLRPLYEKASSVGVFGWARPRFLVVLLDLRRNANLAGGFAGRLVLVVCFVFAYVMCLRF